VQPDGSIQIRAPGLLPGQRVSISIAPAEEVGEAEKRTGPSVIDLISTLPGHRLFHTAEEVDQYVREERDSWDR